MKVKEVLLEACSLLGLSEEEKVLQNEELDESSKLENVELKKLYKLLQFSLRDLCTNYLNTPTIVTLESVNKIISLSDLKNFVRLLDVYYNGKAVLFKTINRKINLPFEGMFDVKYITYPTIESLEEDLEDYNILNLDMAVLGLCAYYCLSTGRFDEFNKFNEQYLDRAESFKELKSFHLPNRRWE